VPFEEAEPDLRAELANQRARRMIADSTEAITDLIAGGATVEDLAERTDLELGSIAWSAGSTEGIAAYDAFRAAAASAREGAPPRLEQFDDGGIFVLRLDSVTPPALRPFEEVRDEVAALWRREATRAAVAAEAERLAARLRTGGGFDQPDLGLVPVVETGMTRRDFLPGAPPDFLARIFGLSVGEVAVIPAEDGTIIARLTAIAAPDPTDPAVIAERARIAEQTMQAIGNDIYQAFTAALQAGTDITVDEAAIAAIHSRMQ
jgi:peptidyl-prolyl cis-trans isomerase D